MESQQRTFLEDAFFGLTLMAITQRGNLYRQESNEEEKKAFHKTLQTKLKTFTEQYHTALPENSHLTNIERLADELSDAHSQILNGGRFRIGTAQKALNLYLKYLWCMGWIAEPPHCPFDAIILAHVPKCEQVRWTQFDSLQVYKDIIDCSKNVLNGKSLAEWELDLYTRSK